jgi:hypothetical protein
LPKKNRLLLQFSFTDSIQECATIWDQLLPSGHHLKSSHLLALEQAQIKDIRYRYIIISQKEKNIGLLYVQLFDFQHKHIQLTASLSTAACIARCLLPPHLPLFICGHLFRIHHPGFYFVNPANNALVFDAIQQFIQQHLPAKPAGILVKDCSTLLASQSCGLRGYRFFDGDVTMEIARKPHWHCFDDYLANLQKNYRQRAKKIRQAFLPITTRALSAAEIKEQAERIASLYLHVVNRQKVKMGIVNANYFYQLKTDLQDRFELYALYAADKMVGFYTFIFYDDEMETHFIGLDYAANEQYKLYFNVLFAGIEKMIEKKLQKLELGRTARLAKANTGALPRQVINYIWVKNFVANQALRYYLKRFNQAENKDSEHRNPFK